MQDDTGDDEKTKKLQAMKRSMNTPTKDDSKTDEPLEKSLRSNATSSANVQPTNLSQTMEATVDAKKEAPPNTTDGKLDKIMEMMKAVALKNDLENMKQTLMKEVKAETKVAIAEAVDPLKNELADIKQDVAEMGSRLTVMEKQPERHPVPLNKDVEAKINALEKQLNDLRQNAAKSFVAVFGGLDPQLSEADAIKVVEEKIRAKDLSKPTATYAKGTYAGFIYAKFNTKNERDACVEGMRKQRIADNDKSLWVDEERPKEDLAIRGFLFGMKKLLLSWQYDKKAIWVDTETNQIYMGDDIMATARVDEDKFDVIYEAGWQEFLEDPALVTLNEAATNRMAKGGRKGAGKTKSKGKQ